MLHARILVRIQEGARHRKTARATIQPAISLMPPHRSYVRRLSRRANWLLTSAVVLKCIVLVVYLTGVGRRNGWATSETVSANGLISYKGSWGLFIAHFEGVYRAGGVEADYIATEPISLWASAAGPNVLHTVRAAQAFSIIGSVLKIIGTVSFVYGRWGAKTATQALALLNKGRLLNLGFLLSNILLTSLWASLPADAFFYFCDVYPQQQGQNSCIRSQFAPPAGNSELHGRAYSFDLVMAAGVCAVIAAVASAFARRSLARLAEEERTRFGGGLLGGGGQRFMMGGAAILDLDEPLVGGAQGPAVVVDPSAPPSSSSGVGVAKA